MPRRRSATVLMPGTCGELVQGTLGGVSFLVSCPINVYASAAVTLVDDGQGIVKSPLTAPKAAVAARKTLQLFGHDRLSAYLTLTSPLLPGKGLGSSTADVTATVYAVAMALGEQIAPRLVADLALSIEPSDGSMFPELVLFDHRRGQLYENLGPPPPLEVVVLDFGGAVDTVAFNCGDWSASLRANEPVVAEALSLIRTGIREGKPDMIGRGATLSAEAHQKILFKPDLPAVLELVREAGVLGLNVAHSGTVIGLLVDPWRTDVAQVHRLARGHLPGLSTSFCCRVVGGGYRLPTAVH